MRRQWLYTVLAIALFTVGSLAAMVVVRNRGPVPKLEEELARLDSPHRTAFLVSRAKSADRETRLWALHKLAVAGAPPRVWLEALRDPDMTVSLLAIGQSGRARLSDAVPVLIGIMRQDDARGLEAQDALVAIGSSRAVSEVWIALVRSERNARNDGFISSCAQVLTKITGDDPSLDATRWLGWAERHEKQLQHEQHCYLEQMGLAEAAAKAGKMTSLPVLRLDVSPSATVWHLNESVTISCRLYNISGEDVPIAPIVEGATGAAMEILVRDKLGRPAELCNEEGLSCRVGGLNLRGLREEDIVHLKPSGCWEYSLQTTVRWAPGEYDVLARYRTTDPTWADMDRESCPTLTSDPPLIANLDPSKSWQQDVWSNTFKITIAIGERKVVK